MPKVKVTCSCGAMLDFEAEWNADIRTEVAAFHEAHAVCRTHPQITMYPTGSFATTQPLTGFDEASVFVNPFVMEHLTHARNSLVGCYMTCEKCGEENDCSDMDAVSFIDQAIASLKGTPS